MSSQKNTCLNCELFLQWLCFLFARKWRKCFPASCSALRRNELGLRGGVCFHRSWGWNRTTEPSQWTNPNVRNLRTCWDMWRHQRICWFNFQTFCRKICWTLGCPNMQLCNFSPEAMHGDESSDHGLSTTGDSSPFFWGEVDLVLRSRSTAKEFGFSMACLIWGQQFCPIVPCSTLARWVWVATLEHQLFDLLQLATDQAVIGRAPDWQSLTLANGSEVEALGRGYVETLWSLWLQPSWREPFDKYSEIAASILYQERRKRRNQSLRRGLPKTLCEVWDPLSWALPGRNSCRQSCPYI